MFAWSDTPFFFAAVYRYHFFIQIVGFFCQGKEETAYDYAAKTEAVLGRLRGPWRARGGAGGPTGGRRCY